MDQKSYMRDCYECPFANKENARENLRAVHFGVGILCIIIGLFCLGAFGIRALFCLAPMFIGGIYCLWRAIVYYRRM